MTPDARITIATSTGPLWLGLVAHFAAGLIALVSGAIALAVIKGGRWHRQAGLVFVAGMVGLGLSAAGIALAGRKPSSVVGGMLTAYLVVSGFHAVRTIVAPRQRQLNGAMAAIGTVLAAVQLPAAWRALDAPLRSNNGVPGVMVLFLASVTVLAAIGDWRLLAAGELRGSKRLARHLWRMCFGLFIASGSFFLGQMKFLPEPLRILPLVGVLAILPLPILLYWMWRVRLRQGMGGLITRASAR